MSIVTKRSAMTLFSDPRDQYSHRVRLVLAEKGVTVDIVDIVAGKEPEDLAELNPYNTRPTLADRDLALYEANVIMEYLDEASHIPPVTCLPCAAGIVPALDFAGRKGVEFATGCADARQGPRNGFE